MYTGSLLSLVAASVVTAPILEELLVRGVLYRNLKGVLQNRYAGMACASLLFGILHGNLVQGLFAFLIGLYLNWIYESEGSLLTGNSGSCGGERLYHFSGEDAGVAECALWKFAVVSGGDSGVSAGWI